MARPEPFLNAGSSRAFVPGMQVPRVIAACRVGENPLWQGSFVAEPETVFFSMPRAGGRQ